MELWEHQRKAIEKAMPPVKHHALLFEPGTGKTGTLINILRQVFTKESRVLKTLILCPTVVCDNWKREWAKFSKLPENEIGVLLDSGSDRASIIASGRHKILITNYQSLIMDKVVEVIKAWGPEVIVADESHRLKTPNAKTTKRAIEIADKAQYKYILTGTPILKNLMDFYSQFKFLDGGETFGRSFSFFKNHYFYDANANSPSHVTWPEWKIRPSAVADIQMRVFSKASYAQKSECLDLPPMLREKIYVEMTPPQKKAYKQMEGEFITVVNDKVCTASIALTMGLRLMQIVSGFIKAENGEITRFKENYRTNALYEILEDLAPEHKVIVWACFKEDYEAIKEVCAKLRLGFVELHGGTKDREQAIQMFQEDPDFRVLIGNQGAGGIGVNLTAASYAIYYSRNFSLEHDIQSEARNYRGGSEIHQKITRIDLVAKGTIDELVLEALSKKQAISDSVLQSWLRR